jgi:G3E family GTPase
MSHHHHQRAPQRRHRRLRVPSERAFDPLKLDEFLGGMVQVFGPRMLRYKGVLNDAGRRPQGGVPGRAPNHGQRPGRQMERGRNAGSKMVFIGKNLPKDVFIQGLEQCLV